MKVWFNRTFSTSSVTRILLVCLATAFVGACQLPLQRGSQESCGFQFRLSIKTKSPCLPRQRVAGCRWQPLRHRRKSNDRGGSRDRCRRATNLPVWQQHKNAAADEVESAVSKQTQRQSAVLSLPRPSRLLADHYEHHVVAANLAACVLFPSAPSRSLTGATGAVFLAILLSCFLLSCFLPSCFLQSY